MKSLTANVSTATHKERGTTMYPAEPDDNAWAWSTMVNLVPCVLSAESNLGQDKFIEGAFKLVMADPEGHGLKNAFANPACLITSDRLTRHFVAKARRAQAMWFHRVRDILHTSGRVKRELRKMSPIIRQLSHTGVLVIEGKTCVPKPVA